MPEPTFEQQLRDTLDAALPQPPKRPERAREARFLARRHRIRTLAAVSATVVAMGLAVPVVRSLDTNQEKPTFPTAVPSGMGAAACRQLRGHGLGTAAYSSFARGSEAASWLRQLHRSVPKNLAGAPKVTICVLGVSKDSSYVVALIQPGRPAVMVGNASSYEALSKIMLVLSGVQESQQPNTTSASFRCPAVPPGGTGDRGSARLPVGTTGALICASNGPQSSAVFLDENVDDLVRSLNSEPLVFRRNADCTGNPAQHGYVLVLRYPRGTRTLEGDACGWLDIGPVQRREADPTFGAQVLTRLEAQERGSGDTQPGDCPAPSQQGPQGRGDLTHVVAARFCGAGTQGNGVILTARQLQRLKAAASLYDGSFTRIEGSCSRPAVGWPHLMLSDAWHEQFSVTLECANLKYWEVILPRSSSGTWVQPVIIHGVRSLLQELDQAAHG